MLIISLLLLIPLLFITNSIINHYHCCYHRCTDIDIEVAQSCPTLCDPMDCSPPGSSIHGIFQARVLEWVAISFLRGSSQPRDGTQVSHIAGRRFTIWATREALWIREADQRADWFQPTDCSKPGQSETWSTATSVSLWHVNKKSECLLS